VAYAVGLVTTMVTRNHVRIGDLASGTLLVYVHDNTELAHYPQGPRTEKQLDATTVEVVSDLLHRWEHLDSDARARIARTILTDPGAAADAAALRSRLHSLIRKMGLSPPMEPRS